ncbi:MAG: hypothetical protein OHK0023_15740 [Anaerolineae bacterium]
MSEKSFSDLSSKLREKRQKEVPEEAPRNFEAIYALRARVLGILIRDARLAANVPPSIVAANVGVDEVTLQAWEFGEDMPTLPQLELLAFTLDVPVSHFFGTQMLPDDKKRTPDIAPSAYYALRDRVIGVKVALARQQLNMSHDVLAEAVGLSTEALTAYEFGAAIPFPVLTSLASALRKSLSYFLEDIGKLGSQLAAQEQYHRFTDLPEEIRTMLAQANSAPFLEIALMMSRLSRTQLRLLGEFLQLMGKMPHSDLNLISEKILDITL